MANESSPSSFLNETTNTFTADRAFFDALLHHPRGGRFVELWMWHALLSKRLKPIDHYHRARLGAAGLPDSSLDRVSLLLIGVQRSLGSLMFCITRGATHEAGAAARQLLEILSLIKHVERSPEKASRLELAPRSKQFRSAFVFAPTELGTELRNKGIQYRFWALTSEKTAKLASDYFDMLGSHFIHVDGPRWIVLQDLYRTPHECMYLNRSVEHSLAALEVVVPIIRLTTTELIPPPGESFSELVTESRDALLGLLEDDHELIDEARSYFGLPRLSELN